MDGGYMKDIEGKSPEPVTDPLTQGTQCITCRINKSTAALRRITVKVQKSKDKDKLGTREVRQMTHEGIKD